MHQARGLRTRTVHQVFIFTQIDRTSLLKRFSDFQVLTVLKCTYYHTFIHSEDRQSVFILILSSRGKPVRFTWVFSWLMRETELRPVT